MEKLEIDYSQLPPSAPVRNEEEWEPPVHKYFGTKDKQTGKMQKEPVYVHQEYPRTVYAKQGNKIVARLVKSDEELKALGKGWEKNPSAFGFIGAPSHEEQIKIDAAEQAAKMAAKQQPATQESQV